MSYFGVAIDIVPSSATKLKRQDFFFMPTTDKTLYDILVTQCTFLYQQDGLTLEKFIEKVEQQSRGYSTLYSTYAAYQLVCGQNVYCLSKPLGQDEILEVRQPEWDPIKRKFSNTLLYTGGITE
jgi:hypothetical protein